MTSCPHCGFYSCKDREKCEKDARYDIERIIKLERLRGPFNVDEQHQKSLKPSEFLGLVAGKLMKRWFK